MPTTGGFSCSNVPRPHLPLSRFRRPWRPLCCTPAGCPLWPATTEASSHSTACDSVTVGFFYDPLTHLRRHLVHITQSHIEFFSNLCLRHIQAPEIQTQ